MLDIFIANFDDEIRAMNAIAPAGWLVGMNLTLTGPQHVHSAFPPGWRERYLEQNYFFSDPVMIWAITRQGAIRWSEVPQSDPRGVMAAARDFGLNHGAIISQHFGMSRSFLSIAHDRREFTDAEIAEAGRRFATWTDAVMNRASLTDAELAVLRAFRDGLGQAETAQALQVSESTVKQRALRACGKLGARTRTQAVAIAVARGYL